MLENCFQYDLPEAGCDEAGRGCLAGPVFAAAVMLPPDFHDPLLNDSKQMTERNREKLRTIIEREAVAWAVEAVSAERIDEINILNASFEGMSLAAARLDPAPGFLAIDGNRFRTRLELPYRCIVKGDGKYADIAAASVLAKTHRDRVHAASGRGVSPVRLAEEQRLSDARTPPCNPRVRSHSTPPADLQPRNRPAGIGVLIRRRIIRIRNAEIPLHTAKQKELKS